MKIGILTQPLRENYGGVLQNYALHRVLQELGHQPITIDYTQYKFKRDLKWIPRLAKRFIFKIFGDKRVMFVNPDKIDTMRISIHKAFIDSHIDRIIKQYPLSAEMTAEEKFGGYIVGSDQVWRPEYARELRNCFLDFTIGQNVKRLSYAASFGVSDWRLTDADSLVAKKCIKTFEAVSVRERDAVYLCEKYLDVSATHVLDPTMLITADQYRELLSPQSYCHTGEVLVYILDMNKNKKAIVEKICRDLGKKPFYVGFWGKDNYTSMESWIAGFDQAEFVITDSFHGTVFSIIFGKQFLNIGNKSRGLSRMSSLLGTFNISMNYVIDEKDSNFAMPSKIDYLRVNDILSEKQTYSLNFLRDNLSK